MGRTLAALLLVRRDVRVCRWNCVSSLNLIMCLFDLCGVEYVK
ncbi:hypothetical protein HanXRQr2_Chr07g0305561 [Helianthus annuus]|uniref:Uncharacterized protein n=1 Tax=Helianthus annuus TaxID=4232 RepID=A0A9K3IN37_HELAN|nr:hypothetical protein HanXRQr2_Chr07g0305561 [Helianthus annuus]KAJ0905599.1 hypothetical protein HanPSC8_Chr07g0295791 [Helianthus annuus]